MKRLGQSFFIIALGCVMLLSACATTAAKKEAALADDQPVITDIRIEEQGLLITGSRPFTFTVYSESDPYRTIVEIPDMSVGSFTGRLASDRAGITEVIPQQVEEPHRVAKVHVVLQSPSTIVPHYSGNTLQLTVRRNEPSVRAEEEISHAIPQALPVLTAQEAVSAGPAPAKEKSPAASAATEISGIDIAKIGNAVKVIVTGNGSMVPNVFPINERIVIDIAGVSLNASPPERVVSPLKAIRAGKHKDKIRLVLDLKEKTSYDVSASGNNVTVTLQGSEVVASAEPAMVAKEPQATQTGSAPLPSGKQPERLVEGQYAGKKISLDFQDADIIPIFRLLADISGYNIVVNPDVKGKVTLKLNNVPWDHALDIILRTFSLSKIVDGNIIRIVPTGVVAKELDELSRAKKAEAEAGDLKTRIIPVNYADLSKLKDAIDKAKVLSSRGSITLDERGSSIIVNDLDTNLEKIDALIKEIDQEHMQARQVMIEAKIVEVNTDYTKELGIQWGTFFKTPGGNSITVGGTSIPNTGATGFSGRNFLVNLPAAITAGSGGSIGFGYISSAANFALDLQLSALENTKKGKILSNPKIMTMNNQEAKITQGRTIYLGVATADKIDFKAIDALLALTVKPRIAPGGAIFMDIDITKDEPTAATAGGVDIIKNTVKTSVLVNNSDTVVIGGIFKNSTTTENAAIPGLSKIPIIGLLFQKDKDIETNNEILIFISPTIVEFNALR